MLNALRPGGLNCQKLCGLIVLFYACWCSSFCAISAEKTDLLQKPVIPHARIAELRAELARLGFGTKSFDEVAQAVVDSKNPDLAFRLLLDGPEIRLWDSSWHGQGNAVAEGKLVRLQLLDLAERPGWGSFTTYPTRDVSTAISYRHPEIVEFIITHWEVKPQNQSWLVEAAQYNLPQTVDLLLERYGDQPWLQAQIPEALANAAANNNRASVIRLMDAKGNPNQVPRGSWFNPLHAALWRRHTDLAQTLVENGARLDACTAAGLGRLDELKRLLDDPLPASLAKTHAPQPLHWAARNAQLKCMEFLLQHGADVNAASGSGWTPLHTAIQSNNPETVQLLLDHQANPQPLAETYYDRGEFLTPLQMAAAEGKLELVQLFIQQGVSPWGRGKQKKYSKQSIALSADESPPGASALTLARDRKHPEVVKYLLSLALADLQAKPSKLAITESDTALAVAAEAGELEMCQKLLQAGARVDGEESITGLTPLQAAAKAGEAEIVKLLLASEAKADGATAESSQTPLHLAAEGGHAEVVKLLLDGGAAVDARQPAQPARPIEDGPIMAWHREGLPPRAAGVRPLTLAAKGGHTAVVKLLLARGADPDLERTEPIPMFLQNVARHGIEQRAKSPLEFALGLDEYRLDREFHPEAATLLIEAGALLEETHSRRYLEMAVGQGSVERLELLERAGVKVEDPQGKLLYSAVANGNRDMIEALIARGIELQLDFKTPRPEHPLKFDEMKSVLIARIIEACPDQLLPIRFERDAPATDAWGKVDRSELFRFYGGTPLPRNNRWLLDAIRHADFEQVNELLKKGYDPNTPHGASYPLSQAFAVKDLKVIELLFEHGAKLESLPDGGSSLLGRVAQRHYDAGIQSEYGQSPYSVPIIVRAPYDREDDPQRDLLLLKMLIDRGADPNRANDLGNTALHTLLIQHKTKLAQALVELGARHDVFSAAALGDVKELGRLLDADSSLASKTRLYHQRDQARTPLDWALDAGEQAAAELLVARQAAVVKGKFQLEEIISSGNHSLLDWFLSLPSDEKLAPDVLAKGLDAAIRKLPQPEMVRVLLKHDADPSTDPMLMVMAAQHGDVAIIDQLVEAGASVNVKVRAYPYQLRHDHDEMSPLLVAVATPNILYAGSPESKHYAAAIERRRKAALRLLELGADPRLSSPGVLTAAVSEGEMELVRKLLAAGADPNDRTSVNKSTNATPLHLAVSKREYPAYKTAEQLSQALEMVDLLLTYGADPKLNSPNDFGGRTPLVLAQEQKDKVVLQRMENALERKKIPPFE